MPHLEGGEEPDEEDDGNIGPQYRKRMRMTQSASNSLRQRESNSDGEAGLALPSREHRMTMMDRRRYDVDNEDVYSPSQDSDSEWEARLRWPKRRKLRPPPPPGRSAVRATGGTGRHASFKYAGSGPQQVLSPPSSQSRNDTATASVTKFNERQIENAVLGKRRVDGIITFRLEWTEDMRCADHKHGDPAQEHLRSKPQSKKRGPSKRKSTTRVTFAPEANIFLIELKEEQGLKWGEIHRRFTDRFPSPERSVGCLQVHYCTKLKRRAIEEG